MSVGFVPPAGPGGFPWFMGEPFTGDPRVSPGLARPIGWEVRQPDGTAAYLKTGLLDTDWTSFADLHPSTAGTLATVYAAGSGSRSTADLMGLDHGTTLRFQANSDASSLPLVGAYETAASKPLATSGIPARLDSLAVDLSLLIGGRLFDWRQMFDPLWDGTFAQLAGYSWLAEAVSFTQNAQTSFLGSNKYGQRAWAATKNYGPPSTPPHNLGDPGDALLHQLALYNGVDATIRNVEQVDGFGSVLRELSPTRNGVVYQWATHWRHQNIVPALGDGVGWGVWNGDFNHGGDVPQAAIVTRTTTADPTNDWLWALQLRDTAGTGQLGDVARFGRTLAYVGAPTLVNGPTTDPIAPGFVKFGAFSDANSFDANLWLANKNTGTGAATAIYFLAGSWDASAGPISKLQVNGPNTTSLGGPQAMTLIHLPQGHSAPITIWNGDTNAGSDIIFQVGFSVEGFRVLNDGSVRFGTHGATFNGPVTFNAAVSTPTYTDGSQPAKVWTSALIDLTVTGTYQIIAPTGFRFNPIVAQWATYTATAVTVSPTFAIGNGISDVFPSQTPAVGTWVSGTRNNTNLAANPAPLCDLTANALSVRVTAAATATALQARLILAGELIPVS